jgi:hypothetical protein
VRYEQRGKTEIFFSNLLLKIGGRKNEKNRKEKVFCFGYGGAVAEALVRRVTTDAGRSIEIEATTRVARALIIKKGSSMC